MIVGSGKFRYRVNADWAKLPAGWSFKEVGSVGVDSNDNVYVFNRGEHPIMVFDREGNFLRSWGEGQSALTSPASILSCLVPALPA
jgi:hypothetical protein